MVRDCTPKSNSRILMTDILAPDTHWLADHYDIKNDAVGDFSRTIKLSFLITGKNLPLVLESLRGFTKQICIVQGAVPRFNLH